MKKLEEFIAKLKVSINGKIIGRVMANISR